jgi:hypothetical protein
VIPESYTPAERAAYSRGRADAARDFQTTLTAGLRPVRDAAWVAGYQQACDDEGRGEVPADRPYALPVEPVPDAPEYRPLLRGGPLDGVEYGGEEDTVLIPLDEQNQWAALGQKVVRSVIYKRSQNGLHFDYVSDQT